MAILASLLSLVFLVALWCYSPLPLILSFARPHLTPEESRIGQIAIEEAYGHLDSWKPLIRYMTVDGVVYDSESDSWRVCLTGYAPFYLPIVRIRKIFRPGGGEGRFLWLRCRCN